MLSWYVLGASGFLGGRCAEFLHARGHKTHTERVDITSPPALRAAFERAKPDVVINFAGAKAYPTIDWCEDHKEETVLLNVAGPVNVATAALEAGAYPIQLSSGCIYSGGPEHAFTEEDTPNFTGSFYSRMRVVMQDALRELPVLQARIRMPLSAVPHPRNFITKIAGYPKVISIPNSVTCVEDLFEALEKAATSKPTGVLNMTSRGHLEHATVLALYKKIVDPSHTFERISLEELEGTGGITKAKRSNCVLSTEKAKTFGLELPELTEDRLARMLHTYKRQLPR